MKNFETKFWNRLCLNHFLRSNEQMLSRRNDFMFYGKFGVDIISNSDLSYPNKKNRPRLIRARPYFYTISDNPNVSLGIVECSLDIQRVAFKDDYQKKLMDMLAHTSVEFNHLENLAKTSCQTQLVHSKNFFNNTLVRRIAIAMNTISALEKFHTGNAFWYQ